jgi:hypothetical protein
MHVVSPATACPRLCCPSVEVPEVVSCSNRLESHFKGSERFAQAVVQEPAAHQPAQPVELLDLARRPTHPQKAAETSRLRYESPTQVLVAVALVGCE